MRQEDGRKLLGLARKSIESYFSKKDVDFSAYKNYSDKQGVFVTLNRKGRLRGCIGFPYPTLPLYQAVFEAARAAAFEDPRFNPVKKEELKDIDIEISVLTVPEEIEAKPEDRPKLVRIGKDGLIIQSTFGSGLLLPQVFTEYHCTPERALEMTCQKAGLPDDAWKDKENKVLRFQATIFSEKEEKKR
ncbi:TIGR00296 family protein [Candidatus Woesearchaeota archaeon]|nr:TIGR00296 family protein [Candidatus Woesearchaeota archaeon]